MKATQILFLALMLMACLAVTTGAATTNPLPTSPGYTPMVVPVMGVYSATRTGLVTWKAPSGYRVMHASVTARASSGTTPTLKVRGKSGTFTLFSTSVIAGTVRDAGLTGNQATDEANVTYDMVIGGTSPRWSDITILMLLQRL